MQVDGKSFRDMTLDECRIVYTEMQALLREYGVPPAVCDDPGSDSWKPPPAV